MNAASSVTGADASLEADLNMSSLDRVELLDRLEERYQVDLSEAQFSEATTVGQLEKLLREPERASAEYVVSLVAAEYTDYFRATGGLLFAGVAGHLSAGRA